MNSSKTDDIRSYLDWAFKGRSAWWAFALGILVIVIMYFVGAALIFFPLLPLFGPIEDLPALKRLIFDYSSFLPFMLTPLVLAWALHKRPWWSVALPRPKVQWWNLGMGFLFGVLALVGIWFFNAVFWGQKITAGSIDLREYVPYFLTALPLVFIQTTSEELAFRGYLMQLLRRMTANPIFIIVLTGVAFGLPHLPNVGGLGFPWYGLLIFVFDGCMFAWLAYRTHSLWMPIGWHWANNFSTSTIISVSNDAVPGYSIFSGTIPSVELAILTKAIVLLIAAFIINYLVSRREQAGEQ